MVHSFQLIHHFLENSATRFPNKVAVVHDGEKVTYSQLNQWVGKLASYLEERGVRPGDRIVLLLENGVDYIVAYYATLRAGAVAVPVNPGLKPEGLKYLMEDSEPTAIISNFKSERLLKAINLETAYLKFIIVRTPKQTWHRAAISVFPFEDSIAEYGRNSKGSDISQNDLASIIYTSGSTGKPKGVMLSHGNIVSNTLSICKFLELTEKDIQMVVLPFFYVMGKSLLNTHVAVGGTVVINNRFLYPADVVNQMVSEGVTGFSGVPSTYAYLLNRSPLASFRDKMFALRYCSQAGGHMAVSIKHDLRKVLPEHTQIFIMYGATEAAARLTYLQPEFFHSKIESIGKPVDGVTIRVMDENLNEVPDGCEGELVASGPNIMQGYWKHPSGTNLVLSEYGYRTGDIGYRDADGFFFVTGRRDGLLKVSGHRVNPLEIEDFLIGTNAIIEVAVVGLPDKLSGNKIVAMIVPKNEGLEPGMIMEKCASHLPNHCRPASIVSVRVLPKNASGKIDRQKCIEHAISLNL